MALMFSDSCDLSLYEKVKWSSIVPMYGDRSRIQFLPTGGINGGGAYQLNADNSYFQYYFGQLFVDNRKNYIVADYSNAAASTTAGTTTRISFWMKCLPSIATTITRTFPILILDELANRQAFANAGINNYYYNTGLPIFLDTDGRLSVRATMYSSDSYDYYVFYYQSDFLRNAVANEHTRLDNQNWHHIEIAIRFISASSATFTIHVDGNLYSTISQDLTRSGTYYPRTIDMVYFMSTPDMDIIYDDIIIWQDVPDTDYTGYKGPTKIYSVVANANSTPSDAIASEGIPSDKWTLVGGVPYNNSWLLNQTWVSLPIGGKEFYEMSNVDSGETIQAISYTMNYASTYRTPNLSVPGIVTSNLVLYLDAANANSFPGVGSNTSGTVWFDLSGTGKHANFVNTPSYNPTSGCFDLEYFDYFLGTSSYTAPFSLPTGSNPRTIIAGFRTPNSNSVGDALHVFHYGSQATSQASGILLWDPLNINTYYLTHHGWGDNPYISNYPLQISKDYIAAIRYNNSASPKFRGFINGSFENFNADSTLNTTTSFQYFVASRIDGSGTEFLQPSGSSGARIYFVMVYDRALTDDEIKQIYDTMKIRFPDLSTIPNFANVRPVLISNGVSYNGATRSSTSVSYSELTEFVYKDFGNSNTNWTANSVSSLIAGFENVG